MRKGSKRRPYQPKNPGTTLVDTIMAASREDVQHMIDLALEVPKDGKGAA